jgi:hypothetical protein
MSIRSGSVLTILLLLSGMACSADKAGESTGSGALGSTWADAAKMPDLFTGMWMTRGGMTEGQMSVPYTAKAQKYVDAYKPKRDIPYAQEGCASPGLPISMRTGPIKFTYAPGLITIYMQAVGHARFIRMNQPMGKTSPKYYGNSVGHWEGDTLVVETADFLPEITFQYGIGKGLPPEGTIGTASLGGGAPGGGPPGAPPGGGRPGGGAPGGAPPGGGPPGAGPPGGAGRGGGGGGLSAAIWGPHGEGMHMVERMRLVDPQTFELQLTIYDDTVWTKPYVAATRSFRRIQKGISEMGPFSGEPEEWVCTVSITSFDPETNTYTDKDPAEMVKYLDKLGR